MSRPKAHKNSADLDAEIARVQRDTETHLQRLQEQRREAEAREDRQRGAVVRECLAGPRAEELRRVIAAVVGPKDRILFGISAPRAAGERTVAVAEMTSAVARSGD